MATSTYGLTSSFCTSAFFAVQGPMNTTFAPGVVSLMYLEIIAIGERLCDTKGTRSGKFLWT